LSKEQFLTKIRKFFEEQERKGKPFKVYHLKESVQDYLKQIGIRVELDQFKDVILEEETEIELGGFGKKSFSIIYPIEKGAMTDGKISLLGPELDVKSKKSLDFGMLIIIEVQKLTEQTYRELNTFRVLSDGIEGFSIRTIPRRFWCRISQNLMKKNFTFEIFGNAIIELYKSKFDNIKSMEVYFINADLDAIELFLELTSQLALEFEQNWRKKVDDWKKRIDCEYDWGCDICPYQLDCQDIKNLLTTRNHLEK
jgi:CO dehydrogenase/acetyl-CoA synthase beta subunit